MKKGVFASVLLFFSLGFVLSGQETAYLSSDQFLKEGTEFHDQGKYDEALSSFRKISKCDPNYGVACYEMALTFYLTDKNDEAFAKCKEAISFDFDQAKVYSLMGSLLDEKGKVDEGMAMLSTALKRWPYNQNLLYNLAVCYLNSDRPLEAERLLMKSVLISPYHSRTHLGLAKANYMMGRIAQSYLAFNMVLLLNPSINNISAYEEAISQKAKLKRFDYKYPYSKDVKSDKWIELGGLLQSELAFNKDFDYDYEYNYTAGRQSAMLFRKLTYEPSDTSIYNRLYARLFVDINQKTGFETYLNYILKNINNEKVNKWSEKNKSKIEALIKLAQSFLNEGRSYGFSLVDEQKARQFYHFGDEGNLESIGEYFGGKGIGKNGPWLLIGEEGYISGRGIYSNDKTSGEWLIYWPNGSTKKQLPFVNDNLEGACKTFYPNGSLEMNFGSKSGKKEGVLESYTSAGLITTKSNYKEDQIDGTGVYFDYEEGFKRTYTYGNGVLEKENIETWLNGIEKQRCYYQKGMLEGAYTSWYSNSSKESERNYSGDKLTGKYYEYYPDNRKSKESEYDGNGNLTGKVVYFDRDGKISSEENEYKEGKLTGTRTEFFPDGKIQRLLRYQKDHLQEVSCFDNNGNMLYNAKDDNNRIYVKSFYPDGIINSEGLLVKDKREGTWKIYNPLGLIVNETNYSNGLLEGLQHTYYANGQVEKEYSSSGDYVLGGYKEYYINGHLKIQGNYDSTGFAGKWIHYYLNDTLSNIMFYKAGKLAGRAYAFYPDGKLKSEETYGDDGKSIRYKEFEEDGSLLSDLNYEFGSHSFDIKFPNGKLKEKKTFTDNVLSGPYETYYPNGRLATQVEYSNGLLNGHFKKWDYKGNLVIDLPYTLGKAEGDAKWFIENKPDFTAHYEQDNLQGKTTSYIYNGQKSRESIYVDNKRNGNTDYYSPEGILMYRVRFVDNSIKAYSYRDRSGNMIPEIMVTDTTKQIKAFYQNGKLSASISLKNGLYDGKFITYYSSGSILRETTFILDENEGSEWSYFPNRKLRELINFKSGERDGLYENYNETGKKQKSGNYFMDNETGDWRIYNADGSLKEVLNYRNGTLYEIKKK